MSNPLKPCPLCEGPALVSNTHTMGFTCCADPGCPMWEPSFALDIWNALPRRSDAAPLVEALEYIDSIAGVSRPKGPCGQAEHTGFDIRARSRAALAQYRGETPTTNQPKGN